MEDDEIVLHNACADLVTEKKNEAFLSALLCSQRLGEWVAVRELCQRVGVGVDCLTPDLFAAWLPDPKSREGYVVIVFYDDESLWSLAALYNRSTLPDCASSFFAAPHHGSTLPGSSVPNTQPAASQVDH